ncbi:MAG TPA: prepilin-type N-terminal cleavage/methylation domain-containing protein, partial [Candidatus Cryosericum sp.]|nr:prepilin-type N-terminal cleavage/methylation domain-containing protein [Candidatus Cryosericum sp.]
MAAASRRGGSEASVVTNRKVTKSSENGFTLVEMLIAAAIFSIVAAVAFIFYTAAQKSYKAGENFSDQQQSTRVAFDRMISDIRLAGFNTNPDGDTSRVDEQVEGAWDTALTIRGDFDFEDPAANATPESALAGVVYNVVSTGNDEIVTYVLAKPGPVGPDTLTLVLDPDRPRAKSNKTISIPNVALVQNNPPYTLYRVTLADISGSFPGAPNAASNFVYEPVADNIRTMSFQYWPDAGVILNPDTPANPADDIGGSNANSVTRSRIRRIAVNLVGMTPDEDLAYVDATDATATTHYRKFDLQSDVNAENLGKTGVKDVDITPPPTPTNVAVVPGHCKGMLVKWDTPSNTSGVAAYTIKYWPNGSPTTFSLTAVTYPHNEYGIVDYDGHGFVSGLTSGVSYCFQVQARDIVGNQSGWAPSSSWPCAVVAEASTPGTPQNLKATGDGTVSPLDSRVQLTWNEVQSNSNTVTGDPDLIGGTTIMRDPKGYKLYRSTTSGFTPDDATNLIAGTSLLGVGVTSYTDTNVSNCTNYYYKLVSTDTCDVVSTASTQEPGRAETLIAPSRPLGLSVNRTSNNLVALTWAPVTTKVDGTSAYIDLYKVYRTKQPFGTLATSVSAGAYSLLATTSTNTYADNLAGQEISDLNNGWSLFYTVSAADLCGNESARSDPGEASCAFNATVTTSPADNSTSAGIIPIGMTISGSGNYARARVRIPSISGPGDIYDQQSLAYPFSFPSWNSAAVGAGDYTIQWEIETTNGCTHTIYTHFTVAANLACQITPTNPNLYPTKGQPSDQNRTVSWDIVNNSGLDLEIIGFDIGWSNNYGPQLPAAHKLVKI